MLGDFDLNANADVDDLDALVIRAHLGTSDLYFDIDQNGNVTQQDVDFWLRELKESQRGDVDLNGEVDFADYLVLAEHFNAPRVRMMLQGGPLRTVLVTTHLALRDVPAALTAEAIVTTCQTATEKANGTW